MDKKNWCYKNITIRINYYFKRYISEKEYMAATSSIYSIILKIINNVINTVGSDNGFIFINDLVAHKNLDSYNSAEYFIDINLSIYSLPLFINRIIIELDRHIKNLQDLYNINNCEHGLCFYRGAGMVLNSIVLISAKDIKRFKKNRIRM